MFYYPDLDRSIMRSSSNTKPYKAAMYNRDGHSHDPLVCVDGWANNCVYVEGSWTGALEQQQKGGANVFVRNSKTQGLTSKTNLHHF